MKKLLTSFLIGVVLLFSIAPISLTKASETWYNQSFGSWFGKVYDTTNSDEIFGERYTAAQVQWIIYSLFGVLINTTTGPDSTEVIQCFIANSGSIEACYDGLNGLLGAINTAAGNVASGESNNNKSLTSLVFANNRPFSGISYITNVLQKLEPISKVRAEDTTGVGFGYNALAVIQDMWKAVRNVAYSLFVLATVIIAFMIMFRVKISPQVVISIQSALPKIITALILVTFSYAIAGFLIDLMYVVIGLFSLILPNLAPYNSTFTAVNAFNWLTKGPMGAGILVGTLLYVVFFVISAIILLLLYIGAAWSVAIVAIAAPLLAGLAPVLGTIGIVIAVILAVVVLFNAFKIWFSLLKAFASIILLTVVAPIQIVAGVVIPNFGFGAWLKSFLSSLSTFVVTGILMYGSFLFLGRAWGVTFSGSDVANTVVSNLIGGTLTSGLSNIGSKGSWPPLLGGGDSSAGVGLLFLGVSFVLFTLVPKAAQIVQGFITGKPFAYGTAIGEAISPVGSIYKNTLAPRVERLKSYRGAESIADIATKLDKQTDIGRPWSKAPKWVKDFLNSASRKPSSNE